MCHTSELSSDTGACKLWEAQILPDPAQIVVFRVQWQQRKRVVKELSVESCGEESCSPNTVANPANV